MQQDLYVTAMQEQLVELLLPSRERDGSMRTLMPSLPEILVQILDHEGHQVYKGILAKRKEIKWRP